MSTVSVEVSVGEVLRQIDDSDLESHGLVKASRLEVAEHHEALFAAAERGDCTAAFAAAERLAWTMYGRILTGKVAA